MNAHTFLILFSFAYFCLKSESNYVAKFTIEKFSVELSYPYIYISAFF